ncbi:MAG: SHOCT domain-containing protein [Nitrososphaerota archaeon]|nr:SHOCT domain-containing protein [Nitrososphaerota archaeon]
MPDSLDYWFPFPFFPLLFIPVVFLLFFSFRWFFWGCWGWGRGGWYGGYDPAIAALRERYAKGEITREQLEQMTKDLERI